MICLNDAGIDLEHRMPKPKPRKPKVWWQMQKLLILVVCVIVSGCSPQSDSEVCRSVIRDSYDFFNSEFRLFDLNNMTVRDQVFTKVVGYYNALASCSVVVSRGEKSSADLVNYGQFRSYQSDVRAIGRMIEVRGAVMSDGYLMVIDKSVMQLNQYDINALTKAEYKGIQGKQYITIDGS